MHLDIDPNEFAANFGRQPYGIRHKLTDHPLLTVESIAVLADSLTDSQVEHNVGTQLQVLHGTAAAPQLDASPGEIARGIETNGCWMVLKNIESDPDYKRLLDECRPELRAWEWRYLKRTCHGELATFLGACRALELLWQHRREVQS